MFRPEPLDLLIIALVAMLVFGAGRLPATAHAVRRAIGEFKDALAGKDDQVTDKKN